MRPCAAVADSSAAFACALSVQMPWRWQGAYHGASGTLHSAYVELVERKRFLLWTSAAGLFFVGLNSIQRAMSLQLDPLEAQFLRYAFGLLVMLPLALALIRSVCWVKY